MRNKASALAVANGKGKHSSAASPSSSSSPSSSLSSARTKSSASSVSFSSSSSFSSTTTSSFSSSSSSSSSRGYSHTRSLLSFKSVACLAFAAPAFLGSLYLLLFHDLASGRETITLLDPTLGKELTELSYVDDCDDWQSKVFDPFTIAHLLGWMVAQWSIRDWKMVTLLATYDEVLEQWWRVAYPNFQECWWDAVILDVLVCNLIGTMMGHYTMKYLHLQPRDWFQNITRDSRVVRSVTLILIFRTLQFLALFGFKRELWVPTPHWINVYRLLAYLVLLEIALEEHYAEMYTPGKKRMFLSVLLFLAGGTDALLCIKYGYFTPIWEGTGTALRVFTTVCLVPCLWAFTLFIPGQIDLPEDKLAKQRVSSKKQL